MNGSVAQLNRALDYGSRGSRFESLRNHSDSWKTKEIGFGSVAQLNRALDYGSRGSRFESLRNHFLNFDLNVKYAPLAQLVEQLTLNQWV